MLYVVLPTITLVIGLLTQNVMAAAANGQDVADDDVYALSRSSSTYTLPSLSSDSSADTADCDDDLSTPAGRARQDAQAIYNRKCINSCVWEVWHDEETVDSPRSNLTTTSRE